MMASQANFFHQSDTLSRKNQSDIVYFSIRWRGVYEEAVGKVVAGPPNTSP